MKVYTLKACDTCRKALKWLTENEIPFQNHDVRSDGLDASDVEPLMKALGWEKLVNRKSTTWRNLSDEQKSDLDDAKAVQLITDNPTLMKRPVFLSDKDVMAGFNEDVRTRLA